MIYRTEQFKMAGCECVIEDHFDFAIIKAGSKVNSLREHAKVRPEFEKLRDTRRKLSKSSKIVGGVVKKDIKVDSLSFAKRLCYGGNP